MKAAKLDVTPASQQTFDWDWAVYGGLPAGASLTKTI
jgi:hypothetical protein